MEPLFIEPAPNPSAPQTYGVHPESVVAVRLQGTLRQPWVDKVYPYGYYHHEKCAEVARTWFESITEEDPHVLALELDWNQPYHCEVCEESIT